MEADATLEDLLATVHFVFSRLLGSSARRTPGGNHHHSAFLSISSWGDCQTSRLHEKVFCIGRDGLRQLSF